MPGKLPPVETTNKCVKIGPETFSLWTDKAGKVCKTEIKPLGAGHPHGPPGFYLEIGGVLSPPGKKLAPVAGMYVVRVNEDANMAQLMEGLKEYSEKSAATPGKIACSYGMSADKKQLFWWETSSSLAAVHAHVERCFPTYSTKIVPNTKVVSMTATCDPAELEETTKFFGQWGADTVSVTVVADGTLRK